MKFIKFTTHASNIFVLILFVLAMAMLFPRLAGLQPYNIETQSMAPEYAAGTLIYVKKTDFDKLKPGDVITYVNPEGSAVTHRITEIDNEDRSLRTKGDANKFEDIMSVAEENIVGKVVFKVPHLGVVTEFLTNAVRSIFSERSI